MKATMIKMAASSLAVGISIACVSPFAVGAISSGTSADESRATQLADAAASDARSALGSNRPNVAIQAAERAVEFVPNSAEYRHLLGRSYLAAGRFASAETSFNDALTLNPDLTRTAFNLALAQIALGHNEQAVSELARLEGRIGASDLGLALALAGQHERAIGILQTAARANGGDSRARQNLALSYALAGRWAESRITASQDVSLAVMNERMTEWAEFAEPVNQWDQVAGLLGVNANPADPGQPVQLALAPVQTEIMVAEAEPVSVDPEVVAEAPVVAFTAPVAEEAVVDFIPDDSTFTDVFVPPVIEADPGPVRTAAPVEEVDYAAVEVGEFIVEDENHYEAVGADEAIAAAAAPDAPPVEMAFAEVPPAVADVLTPAPAAMTEQQWLAVLRAARAPARAEQPAVAAPAAQQAAVQNVNGRYVVQLGAFARSGSLEAAWNRALRRNTNLANFAPSRAVFQNGRTWHRLSVGGFESRREANRLCRTLRGHGQDCFVRVRAGDAPLAVASRGGAGASGRR